MLPGTLLKSIWDLRSLMVLVICLMGWWLAQVLKMHSFLTANSDNSEYYLRRDVHFYKFYQAVDQQTHSGYYGPSEIPKLFNISEAISLSLISIGCCTVWMLIFLRVPRIAMALSALATWSLWPAVDPQLISARNLRWPDVAWCNIMSSNACCYSWNRHNTPPAYSDILFHLAVALDDLSNIPVRSRAEATQHCGCGLPHDCEIRPDHV